MKHSDWSLCKPHIAVSIPSTIQCRAPPTSHPQRQDMSRLHLHIADLILRLGVRIYHSITFTPTSYSQRRSMSLPHPHTVPSTSYSQHQDTSPYSSQRSFLALSSLSIITLLIGVTMCVSHVPFAAPHADKYSNFYEYLGYLNPLFDRAWNLSIHIEHLLLH